MTSSIDALDPVDIIRVVVSSEGNMPLACERLTSKYNNGKDVIEYDILELLTSDSSLQKVLMEQLRALTAIKLFQLLIDMGSSVAGKLDDVKPSELMRAHAALLNAFINITATSTKVTFDLEAEALKAADEFGIPVADARKELKATLTKVA